MGKKWTELDAALHRAGDKKDSERDLFDQKLMELGEHLKLHIELAEMDSPLLLDPADPKAPAAFAAGRGYANGRTDAQAQKDKGRRRRRPWPPRCRRS